MSSTLGGQNNRISAGEVRKQAIGPAFFVFFKAHPSQGLFLRFYLEEV